MKAWTAACWISIMALFGWMGCGRPVPPAASAPRGLPKEIPLTGAGERIPAKEVESKDLKNAVQADFNLDGQKDIALVTWVDAAENEVSIYVKASEPDPASSAQEPAYYRTATLRESLSGKIVGIASRQRGKYTDLVLLIAHTNAPTEMLHYQNDGTCFRLASPDSSPQP